MLSLIKVLLPPNDFPQYTDTPPHDCMRSPHSLVGDVIHIARAARVKARGAIQNLCDAENTGLTLGGADESQRVNLRYSTERRSISCAYRKPHPASEQTTRLSEAA
jgi:hypothetical protein